MMPSTPYGPVEVPSISDVGVEASLLLSDMWCGDIIGETVAA